MVKIPKIYSPMAAGVPSTQGTEQLSRATNAGPNITLIFCIPVIK